MNEPKHEAAAAALNEIDNLTRAYSVARQLLSSRVAALTDEVQAANRRKLPGIKLALAEAKDLQAKLVAAVQAHPELFESPRTMSLHGIKVGYAKGKGRVEWECEDDVLVSRIEKLYKDDERLALLINTTKTPAKDALKELDGKELARLGVTVESTGDRVIVKASDTEVDKLVKKILAEGEVEEAAAA